MGRVWVSGEFCLVPALVSVDVLNIMIDELGRKEADQSYVVQSLAPHSTDEARHEHEQRLLSIRNARAIATGIGDIVREKLERDALEGSGQDTTGVEV